MRIRFIPMLLVLSCFPPSGHSLSTEDRDEAGYATSSLDARVLRLEKKVSTQSMTEILREVDRLKDEIRRLRGEMEEWRNGVERERQQELDQRSLIQERLTALEARLLAGGGRPEANPAPTGAASQPTQASAMEEASTVDRALSSQKTETVPKEDPKIRQKSYEHAFEVLKLAQYTEAISEFQAFVAKYPTGEFSDNAQYWLGEALYMNRAFVAAREAFKKLISDFPQSPKVADAKLKLGFIEYENQQYAKAKEVLGEIVKSYPETTAARMAEKRLERMRQENR